MPPLVDRAEDIVAVGLDSNNVRIYDVFRENDRLKTDFIPATSFLTILEDQIKFKLTDDQRKVLVDKYTASNGYINYREFARAINCRLNKPIDFTEKNLVFDPEVTTLRPLSAESSGHAQSILTYLANFYGQRNIDVKSVFDALDEDRCGKVPRDVFLMHLPEQEKLSYENLDVLARKYEDIDNPKFCNYLRLANDITSASKCLDRNRQIQIPLIEGYSNKDAERDLLSDVLSVIEKIQVLCFKHGIRSLEFFRDFDKLRLGLCKEPEFKSGVDLFTRQYLALSKKQLDDLANFYKVPDDGRIYYKAFCDLVENTFNIPNLDKKPLATVQRPLQGVLIRPLNSLEPMEDARLQKVMGELAHRVQDRRLNVFPFFKDFDRGKGYSQNVTKNQFARIMAILGISVQPEDFRILCRRFEEQSKGDINYPAFVQAIDYMFTAFKEQDAKPAAHVDAPMWHEMPLDTSNVNLDEIIARVKQHCLVNSIRITEGFQDFDGLRHYSISNSQFRRGLITARVFLSNSEAEVLCNHFGDPAKPGNTLWKRFCDEINSAFSQIAPNMERTPLNYPPARADYDMPPKGAMDWRSATGEHRDMVDNAMQRFREYIAGRRCLIKPTFEKFDRLNHRYVTRQQFKQCLTMLDLAATDEEMSAVEHKFSDDKGFNYWKFIQELEPSPVIEQKYAVRMAHLKELNSRRAKLELEYESNFDRLLNRMKTFLKKKPVRVVEFMVDFDRFKNNTISKENFIRALDICGFKLEAPEKEILYAYYQSPSQPGQVEYRRLCEDLESAFTTHHLEKSPQCEPAQFQTVANHEVNQLTADAAMQLTACMQRLADRVLPTRMQLFPPFRDFDRHHRGQVSREQFRRVLNEQLNLGAYLSERDYTILFAKFAVDVGGQKMVDYVPFCQEIYRLAHIDFQAP